MEANPNKQAKWYAEDNLSQKWEHPQKLAFLTERAAQMINISFMSMWYMLKEQYFDVISFRSTCNIPNHGDFVW